jgi:hypothetical protein
MSLKRYDEQTRYAWEKGPDADRFERFWKEQRAKPTNAIFVGTLPDGNKIYLAPDQLGTHVHVIGVTGTGKSYFIESLVEQLIYQGYGVCVTDPHGDLYHRVLSFCAYLDLQQPELRLAERVIPFDVAERRQILGFNPMKRRSDGMEVASQAKAMMEAIRKCWGQASFDATPRLGRWLYNICAALIEADLTFVQAYHLVEPSDNPLRRAILEAVTRPTVKSEWEALLHMRLTEREERLESSLNRIKPFIEQPAIRRVIGQHTHTLDVDAVIEQSKVWLVNLSRQNEISEDDQNLIGTFIVNALLISTFAKPKAKRKPFFLICDEFERFVTPDMAEILDGGRKFDVHLVLAHQHLQQLKQGDLKVYNSTLTNARTKVVFGGLSEEDLDVMAKELFTGELDPDLVKQEIYQTKFRPVESRRVVTTHSDSYGSSDSSSDTTNNTWGHGDVYSHTDSLWAGDELRSHTRTWAHGSGHASGSQSSQTSATSESEVPFVEHHEFTELSSREFRSLDEQLYMQKARLKRQLRQHYALLLPGQQVQFVKSPTYAPQFRNDFPITGQQKDAFLLKCFAQAGCFKSPEAADQEIAALEARMLAEPPPPPLVETGNETEEPSTKTASAAEDGIMKAKKKAASKPAGRKPRAPRKKPQPKDNASLFDNIDPNDIPRDES